MDVLIPLRIDLIRVPKMDLKAYISHVQAEKRTVQVFIF
jgi:hypothetical protein